MSGYPIELITDYKAGKISRRQFIKQFSEWQKANTINFDCKGTADRSGTYITYRGIKAEIKNGKLIFIQGFFNAPDGTRVVCRDAANSVYEFCRKVDFCKNISVIAYSEKRGVKWN